MNKFFVSTAVFLVSGLAMAMPKVGDDAVFNVTFGGPAPALLEMELVGFDSGTNNFMEKTTVTYNGTSQVNTQSLTSQQLLNDLQVASILASCANYGGVSQNITVPAGTFATCALPQSGNGIQSGTVWIGAVSFGFVKSDLIYTSGAHTILELVSQRMAP